MFCSFPGTLYLGGFAPRPTREHNKLLLTIPVMAMQIQKSNQRVRDERVRLQGEMEAARHVPGNAAAVPIGSSSRGSRLTQHIIPQPRSGAIFSSSFRLRTIRFWSWSAMSAVKG